MQKLMNHSDEGNPLVSVVMTAYNHERYIEQALQSVLIQKTNFRYEILICDDASTDGTARILLKFAELFPGVVIPIIREKNIGGSRNFTDLLRKARGRYIVFIEGDDYWIDEAKMQTQLNYLDNNPSVFCVAHRVKVCGAKGEYLHTVPRYKFPQNRITVRHFLKGLRFPLTATMIRNVRGDGLNKLIQNIDVGPRNEGDTTICMFLLDKGAIEILEQEMAVYRYRSLVGHDNYNSITKFPEKIRDKLLLIKINEELYLGKYFMGWMYIWLAMKILRNVFRGNLLSSKITIPLLLKVIWLYMTSSIKYMASRIKPIH